MREFEGEHNFRIMEQELLNSLRLTKIHQISHPVASIGQLYPSRVFQQDELPGQTAVAESHVLE
jgi:hypothetical protein